MKQRDHKILYAMHSGAGIWLGILFCLIALTGAYSVIEADIRHWEMKRWHQQAPALSVDQTVQDLVANAPGHVEFVRVDLPFQGQGGYRFRLHVHDEADNETNLIYHQKADGTLGMVPDGGLANFYVHLHSDLWLPGPWGRYLVGLLGLLMMVLTITGILIHGHIIRDFFKLRSDRSERVKWMDAHKVMGLIGLPFHFVISFTGALLGLTGIFLFAIAYIAYDGDQEAALTDILGSTPPEAGISAPMVNLDSLIADAQLQLKGLEPEFMFVLYPNDQNARVQISGSLPDTLTIGEPIIYDGVSGQIVRIAPTLTQGAAQRAIGLLAPLHYGRFDGAGMRLIYFLLGIGMAALTATGTLIWLDKAKQARRRKGQDASLNMWQRSLKGAMLGLFPAGLVPFIAALLLPPGQREDLFAWVALAGWVISAGLLTAAPQRAKSILIGLIGILALVAILAMALQPSHHVPRVLQTSSLETSE